jgi:hypothetical protein
MRSRIGMALGPYWGGIVHAIDIIVAMSVLGTLGGLSALLSMATPYVSNSVRWLKVRWSKGRPPSGGSDICKHGC